MTIRYANDFRIDALIAPFNLINWNLNIDAVRPLNYTFDTGGDQQSYGKLVHFNAAQETAAVAILTYATSVTGIVFEQVATDALADIHFAAGDISNATFGGETRTHLQDAYIYLDNVQWANDTLNPVPGSVGYQLLLHEIGHALGLVHPFEGDRPLPGYLNLDSTANTVLSYTSSSQTQTEFQPFDLLALYWLFGGDGLGGERGFNSVQGPSLPSNMARAQAGTPGADSLMGDGVADALDDALYGGPGNDVLLGGAGRNYLDGGDGVDTAKYLNNYGQYTVAYSLGEGSVVSLAGAATAPASRDQFTHIERLRFADFGLAFDVAPYASAGQSALLIGAICGQAKLLNFTAPLGVGMSLFDQGATMLQLSAALMRLPIWTTFAGAASNFAIASYLLETLNGAEADLITLRAAVASINTDPQGTFLSHLAQSPQNQLQVDLVGLASTGLHYA